MRAVRFIASRLDACLARLAWNHPAVNRLPFLRVDVEIVPPQIADRRKMATRSNGVANVRSGKESFDNEDYDDAVQIYGTSIESAPLKPKRSSIPEDSIVVKIEDRFRDMKILDRLRLPDDAMSKDSDSLINAANYYSPEKYDPRNGWWKHPKVKENWKIVLAAFVLLIIGLGLLVSGVIVEVIPTKAGYKGLVFFIAGAICFIPGVYHVVYVYCAVKGRRGFDFHNLPLFN